MLERGGDTSGTVAFDHRPGDRSNDCRVGPERAALAVHVGARAHVDIGDNTEVDVHANQREFGGEGFGSRSQGDRGGAGVGQVICLERGRARQRRHRHLQRGYRPRRRSR